MHYKEEMPEESGESEELGKEVGEKQPCSVTASPPRVLKAGGRGGRGEALWIP